MFEIVHDYLRKHILKSAEVIWKDEIPDHYLLDVCYVFGLVTLCLSVLQFMCQCFLAAMFTLLFRIPSGR